MGGRRQSVGGWACAPAFIFMSLLGSAADLGDFYLPRPFDRSAWIEARVAAHSNRTRLRMTEDLRASGQLDRLTRAGAVALLGEPSERTWGHDTSCWVWAVGPTPVFPIDTQWLRLGFGRDGRVQFHDVVWD